MTTTSADELLKGCRGHIYIYYMSPHECDSHIDGQCGVDGKYCDNCKIRISQSLAEKKEQWNVFRRKVDMQYLIIPKDTEYAKGWNDSVKNIELNFKKEVEKLQQEIKKLEEASK